MTKRDQITKKIVPARWENSFANTCATLGLALNVEPKPSPFSTSSSTMSGHQGWLESQWCCAESGKFSSPGACCSGWLETPCCVFCEAGRTSTDASRSRGGARRRPLECSLALVMVAPEARSRAHPPLDRDGRPSGRTAAST